MDLIGLAGWAKSGKNAVGDILIVNGGYHPVAFADKLRDAMAILDPIVGIKITVVHNCPEYRLVRYNEAVYEYGYEAAKDMFDLEVRKLLQRMGTDVGRNFIGPDTWVGPLMAQIDAAPDKYVITDVRFPNEADAIRSRGGRVYWISRPGVGPANDHYSEHALDDYDFDAVIDNSGSLDDLTNEARSTILGI